MLQIYNLKANRQKILFAIKTFIVFIFCIANQSAFSQSVSVTATNDVVDGTTTSIAALIATPGADGKISLREAIMATNGEPSGANITITLPAATLVLSIAGTGETGGAPNAAIGDLDLLAPATGTKTVTINGTGVATTIISQTTGIDRIIDAHPNSTIAGGGNITLNISGVKMTGGVASGPPSGGAILAGRANDVTTLSNCLFDLNSSPSNGGAISQSSSIVSHNLTITNCTFSNNSAGGAGGAVSYNGQGTALITGSVFSNNKTTIAGGDGGALSTTGGGNGGTYTVEKNTFLNNQVLNPTGHAGVVINGNGTLTLRYNRFIGNTCANTINTPLANIVGQLGGSNVNTTIADNNWWGVNTGPGTNDAVALNVGGTMTVTKWLQLKHTANPVSVVVSPPGSTTLTASFLSNSANEAIAVGDLSTVIGLPITFNNATKGIISSPQSAIQASGTATATYTVNANACPPPGTADAIVDNATATASIIIVDNIPPTITCPGNITNVVTEPGACHASVAFTVTANDNCPGVTFTCTASGATTGLVVSGSNFNKGTTVVTCQATDAAGNVSITCNFNVIVIDNQAPVISVCPIDITVQTGAGNTTCTQTATWTAPTAMDNCDGNTAPYFISHPPGSSFLLGTTTVTYKFKDIAGNESICSFNVTVVDNTPPVINGCPTSISVSTGTGNVNCTQTASWTEPTATDACGTGPITFFSRSHAPGDVFSKGTTTVNYLFKDAAGNESPCSFTVTVLDNTSPTLSCPQNVVAVENPVNSGSATVTYPAATATDNCAGIKTIQYSQASGTSFPIGVTTVNVSVQDAEGNISNCSFTVTVNPACQISCPVVNAVGNTPGQCGAIVNYSVASTTGSCGSLTYSHPSGSVFPVGVTMVTVSSVSTGQSCQFAVTVNDTEFPAITVCPGNQVVSTANNLCTAPVSFSASASDNCPTGLTVKYYIGITEIFSGHSFPKGVTTVAVKAKDAAGNETTCSFTVTVNDTQNPSVTAPADVTVSTGIGAASCSKLVTIAEFGVASHSDNCPGQTLQITGVPAGNIFPVGTTVLTYRVTDAAGLQATDQQNIIVVDNTLPVLSCPGNVTVYTGAGRTTCNQTASWTVPSPSDNCGIQSLTANKNPGDLFPVGTTTVTYTALDVNGNQSQCSFTVNVIDNTPPVISGCPSNITAQTGAGNLLCSKAVTWTEPTATDNCGAIATYFSRTHAPGSTFTVGTTTTVTYVFKDAAGIQSSCSFDVVVQDNTPPVISGCPSNITVQAFAGTCAATASWIEPTATDNCGAISTYFSRSHAPGASFTGVTTVTYVFKDAVGNQSTCSFTVTVQDVQPPVINTIASPIVLLWPPDHKYQRVTVAQLVTSVTDNCGGSIPVSNVIITKVTSDELENAPGSGDGNTTNDMKIASNCKSVDLRRERMAGGNGRVYTIHFSVQDGSGNTGTATARAIVTMSQNGTTAVDDGPIYTVNGTCGSTPPTFTARGSSAEIAINDNSEKAVKIVTAQNYPNPFTSFTTIRYTLPANADVSLIVFDKLGQIVAKLAEGRMSAGYHNVRFEASHLASGTYTYRLQTTDAKGKPIVLTGKMMLAK